MSLELSDNDICMIVELHNNGMHFSDIARSLDIPEGPMYAAVVRSGKYTPKPQVHRNKDVEARAAHTHWESVERYLNGEAPKKIARELGVDPCTVYWHLKKEGVYQKVDYRYRYLGTQLHPDRDELMKKVRAERERLGV